MTLLGLIIGGVVASTVALHIISIAIVLVRCLAQPRAYQRDKTGSGVSIIRPLYGFDNFIEETLESSFRINHPNYEVIFCLASAMDPVAPIVKRLIKKHPGVSARLLIGDERISSNPKLNNCVKGCADAAHDLIVFSDGNVLMPRDYLSRMLASWQLDTGLVSSPPIGSHPRGFWANVECAFLNSYEARWQYAADTIGVGFAQGKNMLWKREALNAVGGLPALGREMGDDAAFTKVIRAAGLRVRLVDPPFSQPLGYRGALEVWRRQVRWSKIRRSAFPLIFALEILAGLMLPFVSWLCLATRAGLPLMVSAVIFVAIWYGAEMLLAQVAGWPLSLAYPLYAATRDLLLPVLWFEGWRERGFIWRGIMMSNDKCDPVEQEHRALR